ncbi:MAG: bacterio-opsin activator domain-containing protein [Halapricum sp.]
MDDRLERAPLGVLEVAADGTVTDGNEIAGRLLGSDEGEWDVPLAEVAPRSVDDSLLEAVTDASISDARFEEYYPDLDQWLSVSVVPVDEGAVVYLQDVTGRRRTERSVERLREERERTAVIDTVLSEVLADLVGASSREEIAETICRTLGESDRYEFAWVGERDLDGDGLVVRAVAGETGETFEAIRDALDDAVRTPEMRAVERGEKQIVKPLADGANVPEAVRMAGFADGVHSLLAIPLVYGSNVHGVAGVYASGDDVFSERERNSFETLGEVAGFAITAARNRSLLLSDDVTELTLDVGNDSVLATLSGTFDAELTLVGIVPYGEDALLCFLAVEGAEIQSLADAAAEIGELGTARPIRESGSGGTIEVEMRGSTPLLAISELGGTVRRATFDDGDGRIVIDLPRDSDVRRIVETIDREYDTELVAKRERERSVTTARGFRDELDDRLTERQRTVLRTAHLADYFESPRGSTAEEVASTLDITGSTLLYHLRASQRKLLDAYFDDRTDSNAGSDP